MSVLEEGRPGGGPRSGVGAGGDTDMPEPGSVEGSAPPSSGRRALRFGLWALFGLVLVGVAILALLNGGGEPRGEPLPVLGQVPDFALVGRDGAAVERADLAGMPWVADFVFTRCVASCPLLTARMKGVGDGLAEGEDFRRVSFSVDPEHDRPEVLRAWAEGHDLPATWWSLTGETEALRDLIRNGFHLALEPDTGDPQNPIAHSNRFVLVDGEGAIRGYYQPLEEGELERLSRDLRQLTR